MPPSGLSLTLPNPKAFSSTLSIILSVNILRRKRQENIFSKSVIIKELLQLVKRLLPSHCTAFSQAYSVNSLRWCIRGKRAGNTRFFARTTWPETNWTHEIMRPRDSTSMDWNKEIRHTEGWRLRNKSPICRLKSVENLTSVIFLIAKWSGFYISKLI